MFKVLLLITLFYTPLIFIFSHYHKFLSTWWHLQRTISLKVVNLKLRKSQFMKSSTPSFILITFFSQLVQLLFLQYSSVKSTSIWWLIKCLNDFSPWFFCVVKTFWCRLFAPKTKGMVPKIVHKAGRERLKHEWFNELFFSHQVFFCIYSKWLLFLANMEKSYELAVTQMKKNQWRNLDFQQRY